MNCKISVVIPAFNRAKTIKYCLDSVCGQSYPPLEVLVVDDCSADDTVAIVNEYSRKYGFVRCIQLERNSGAQAARNQGILEARGDWISFQDSDDEWLPKKLELQVAALESADYDPMIVVHADAWVQETSAHTRYHWKLPKRDGHVYKEMLTGPSPMFQAMLVSRVALMKIGLLDVGVPSYQEWDTSILLSKVCRFIHIRKPLFVYYKHQGPTISKDKSRDIDGYQYITDKYKQQMVSLCGSSSYLTHLQYNAYRAASWGLPDGARSILNKSDGSSLRSRLLRFYGTSLPGPAIFMLDYRMRSLMHRILAKVKPKMLVCCFFNPGQDNRLTRQLND